MKNRILTLAFLIAIGHYVFAQDQPNHFSNYQKTVEPRGNCIEVLNSTAFYAGEFGDGNGTASVCFVFPSTCGAEIKVNSNSVVDFVQFIVDGDTSGIIGVGSSGFDSLEYLGTGDLVLLPFDFNPVRAFEGPVHVDVGPDGFIVEKLDSGLPGDMFLTVSLDNFSVALLSNIYHFTNWSIECTPLHTCTDYIGIQYAVACPDKKLDLISKCFDTDYKTTWVNPFGDTIICHSDTLHIDVPVPVGLYKWNTPCNNGYYVVYDPDSVKIQTRQVFCSSKQKIFLPIGLKGNWSTGAKNTNYVYISQPGWYFVTVSDCVTDSIFAEPEYQAIDLELNFVPNVDTLLFSKELDISASAISNVNIMWYKDGSPIGGYVRRPGFYTIVGTFDECREYDTLLVIPKLFSECDWPVYGPNAFSPNGDGDNDEFEVFGPMGSTSEIWVYDRWGELVYRGDKWDGTHKGLPCNPGVYVFRAKVVWNFEECTLIKGDVAIIR